MINYSTGEFIKEFMNSENVSIGDLAKASNLSERSVYRFLKGESKLTFDLVEGIKKLWPDFDTDLLYKYERNYWDSLERFKRENELKNINNVIKLFKLDWLYDEDSKIEKLEKAKAIFGLKNLQNLTISSKFSNYAYFSKAKNSDNKISEIWINSALYDYKSENEVLDFKEEIFYDSFKDLRELLNTSDVGLLIENFKMFANKCGINFFIRRNIPNSRIKAVTYIDEENHIYIFISDLFKLTENLSLSLMHECLHIFNKDLSNEKISVEDDEYEKEIDKEAIYQFIGEDGFKTLRKTSLNSIYDVADFKEVTIGLVAEIYRRKFNAYDNPSINDYLHYFKSEELFF